ncbi:hypothetical protein C7C56_017230, partial [Massilia glaciei]
SPWVKSGKLAPPRDYLVQQMPKRIFAPGKVPAYSSYGTALAAHIVERVSGKPFETYIERHIFSPLGMHHSSFAQPLPPRLAPMLSKGYVRWTAPPQVRSIRRKWRQRPACRVLRWIWRASCWPTLAARPRPAHRCSCQRRWRRCIPSSFATIGRGRESHWASTKWTKLCQD